MVSRSLIFPNIFHLPSCVAASMNLALKSMTRNPCTRKRFTMMVAKFSSAGVFAGVAGDQSAKHHAAVQIHAVEHGVHDFTAHVFKIDVDALRRGGGQFFFPVGMFVIDGGVEAQVFGEPFTFVVGLKQCRPRGSHGFCQFARRCCRWRRRRRRRPGFRLFPAWRFRSCRNRRSGRSCRARRERRYPR